MEKNSKWTSDQILLTYLAYYQQQGCPLLSSIAPTTNQVQFTNSITQLESVIMPAFRRHPDLKSAVAIQKSFRFSWECNELRLVEIETFHHSYFEMLSAYSIGLNSQEEIIAWTLTLLTEVYGLDKDQLIVTYYDSDHPNISRDVEMSKQIWDRYLPQSRLPTKNQEPLRNANGDVITGGIYSEIYYTRIMNDKNESIKICTILSLNPDAHNKDNIHNRIITGAFIGLERLATILQKKTSNYETDAFSRLLDIIQKVTGAQPYSGKLKKEDIEFKDKAYRIVADHIRTLTIAMANGITPGPSGRGYALRRLIRRAYYFLRDKLNAPDNSLQLLVEFFVAKESYPEVSDNAQIIQQTIANEEITFNRVYGKGMDKFHGIVKDLHPGDEIPVDRLYHMYNTYGFQFDLLEIMAEELGLYADPEKFEQKLNPPKVVRVPPKPDEIFRLPQTISDITQLITKGLPRTEISHHTLDTDATVRCIWVNSSNLPTKIEGPNKTCGLILDRTNFCFGPGSDTGIISGKFFKFTFDKISTHGNDNYLIHIGTLVEGRIRVGDEVQLHVDGDRRSKIMAQRTANHLLAFAMQNITHWSITNCEIYPDRHRLDFTSEVTFPENDAEKVDTWVNQMILRDLSIDTKFLQLTVAESINGISKFGRQTQSKIVCVASVGVTIDEVLKCPSDPKWRDFTIFICNGPLLTSTGQLQHFAIIELSRITVYKHRALHKTRERRLIAVIGEEARNAIKKAEEFEEKMSAEDSLFFHLKDQLIQSIMPYHRKSALLKKASILKRFDEIRYVDNIAEQKERGQRLVNEVKKRFENSTDKFLIAIERLDGCIQQVAHDIAKSIVDETTQKKPMAAMIFTEDVTNPNKPALLVCCVVNLRGMKIDFSAKLWIAAVMEVIGGKSGGTSEVAQGRGHLLDKIDEAMKVALEYTKKYSKY